MLLIEGLSGQQVLIDIQIPSQPAYLQMCIRDSFQPEDQFQPELVTKDPNCILLQTRASDKYALAKEMNAFYQHQLSINTWGGPLNILECTPKGINKAFALDYLLKVMNRDKKDLIAFGDCLLYTSCHQGNTLFDNTSFLLCYGLQSVTK